MNNIRQGLQQYLTLRAGLGFVLQNERTALYGFVSLLETEGASHITTELAMRGRTVCDLGPTTGNGASIRCLVQRLRSADRSSTAGTSPLPHQRRRPYIYSNYEIEGLVRAAAKLPSPKGLRGLTYSTVFGLLVVTGMRV